ncbi:MAG: hypothetical protein JJE53_02415 [Candidatus Pacebacteria bacterium]|nr:hypothetical protein [Candidatus Paceibacterota bacterium]
MANLKLKLKINGLEFEIEGEDITVKEEFSNFKSFISSDILSKTNIIVPPMLDAPKKIDEIDVFTDGIDDFPVLTEVVKKDLPKSEPEWVLLYAFYTSAYGENTFSIQNIKDGYESSKRKNASRLANLSNNIKQLLNGNYIKMLNDTDYIFLEEGKKKVSIILNSTKLKNSSKKTVVKNGNRISEKQKTNKTNKTSKRIDIKSENFEIHPEGKTSLENFFKEKNPNDTARERILVIAYYIKNILVQSGFTDGNIEFAYRALSLKNKPIHLRQVITNIKNDHMEIGIDNDLWIITRIGEKFVDEKLPHHEKSK